MRNRMANLFLEKSQKLGLQKKKDFELKSLLTKLSLTIRTWSRKSSIKKKLGGSNPGEIGQEQGNHDANGGRETETSWNSGNYPKLHRWLEKRFGCLKKNGWLQVAGPNPNPNPEISIKKFTV